MAFTKQVSYLFLICLSFVVSCGSEKQISNDLKFYEDKYLSSGVEVAYIVAFRASDEMRLAKRTSPYFRRQIVSRQARSLNLAKLRDQKGAGVNTRFIASLDLKQGFAQAESQKLRSPQMKLLSALESYDESSERLDFVRMTFESEAKAREVLRELYEEGDIWFSEPDGKTSLNGEREQEIIEQFKNPASFPWLDQVDFIQAMQNFDARPPTAPAPVVAVLDSGIDVEHPALSENIYDNTEGANRLCVDDRFGCDTTVADKDILGRGTVYPAGTEGFGQQCPENSGNCTHGTHVAGIVAGYSDEFVGLCPYCEILPVKVVGVTIDANGQEDFAINDSAILAGLAYVAGFTVDGDPLVRVINASFGKFQASRSVGIFIEALRNFGKGVLVVAAAGNEDTMKRQFPAGFDDVLAVSNVWSDRNNPKKARSSNFGMWVDIAAPGSGVRGELLDGIISSIPGNQTQKQGGTSMASPVVAGIAALVLTREPDLDFEGLRSRVLASAIPDDLYRDGVNNAYSPRVEGAELVPLLGAGVVNALAAVDPTAKQTTPILTQRRDAISPGCGVVGHSPIRTISMWILILPVFLWSVIRFRSFGQNVEVKSKEK